MADYNGGNYRVLTWEPAFEGGNPIFAQRVYSSGLNQWCYYTGPLNANPLPAETTPNWTGSISRHENLGNVGL